MNRLRLSLLIFVLTVLDVFFSTLGLKTGMIAEANPLMDRLIHLSLPATMAGVLVLISAAVYLFYRAMPVVRWLPTALAGVAAVKIVVVVLHLRWLVFMFTGDKF